MRKNRLLPIVLLIAVACGYVLLSPAQAPKEVRCGLGPPPGSSEFVAFEARQSAEVQRLGYEMVCEGMLTRYDVGSDLRPVAAVVSELDFQPVDLTATPFNSFSTLGAFAEDVSGFKSRLYRSFKMPDGHIVTLYENDMSADGTQSYRNPKDEPERVNDFPARLSVLQTSNGKAISVISWTEGRRYYEIWLDANVIVEKKKGAAYCVSGLYSEIHSRAKGRAKIATVHIGARR